MVAEWCATAENSSLDFRIYCEALSGALVYLYLNCVEIVEVESLPLVSLSTAKTDP